jgi:hypothetical protein
LRLIETILKLYVQLLIFCVTLLVKVVSAIVGALWQAWLNRAPRPTVYKFEPQKFRRRSNVWNGRQGKRRR